MNITTLSARDLGIIMALATIVVGAVIAVIALWLSRQKRRAERLRTHFGRAEYRS